MRLSLTLLASLLSLIAALSAPASVHILTGPTLIPGGTARAAADITVVNEKLALALAVESAAPYGVPRGAIVALAPVRHGTIGHVAFVVPPPSHDSWYALRVVDQRGRRAYTNPVWVRSL